jgi:ABC-type sugar transport system ATPase subunit
MKVITGIYTISSDMPEIISLARRIIVMKNYKITGEVSLANRSKSYGGIK